MKVIETDLDGVVVIEPRVFEDDRGGFFESWNADRFAEHGLPDQFVQDNVSTSRFGVLRGLHYQNPSPQAKLVSVLHGEVFDVAVDIRTDSDTFGNWFGVRLSAGNGRQLFVPEGFAHGFSVLSKSATVYYKATAFYNAEAEGSIRWDDPDVDISWPIDAPILSPKDDAAPFLKDVPRNRLFCASERS